MEVERFDSWWDQLISMAMYYAPRVALAVLLLVVGIKLINRVTSLADRGMDRGGVNVSLRPFLRSLVSLGLKVMLIVSIAGLIGIDTASIIAVLAAASFAVGLALQGSLSNFAAGIVILLFKPYQVGDWIEVEEKFGRVLEIQLFNTIITTPGQKTLIIPNSKIIDNIVTNFSTRGHLRLELRVTIPYDESFPRVRTLLLRAVSESPFALQEPAPEVGIETYDSHNVIIGVRPYVKPDDYWRATFDINARIKRVFYENHVKVAYPEGVELGNIGE